MQRGFRLIFAVFLFTILLSGLIFCAPVSEQVIVDQFGWRAGSKKVAVLAKPVTGQNSGVAFTLPANGAAFEVRRALDNSTAYAGTVTSYNAGATNVQSGDKACWADFTPLITPGTYYIYDPTNNVQSYNFDIRDDIFNNILKTAGKFFYYQRCGINIDAGHGGNWNHTACHEGANQDLAAHLWNAGADQGQAKDVHGGWHDAGDYNKYVPFTLDAVFALLMAYELNPAVFGDDWNIAESGNGVPDVLDEIKYELDWMLRMQNSDGSVCNRVGVLNYVAAYPQNDSQARYYTLPTTWATSTLAGLAAHGARLFGAYNAQYPGYVNTLTTAAQNAWAYLAANTAMTPASGLDGGGAGGGAGFAAADGNGTAADDARRRLFAAAELYKTTGTVVYRTYFDSNYASASLVDAGHQPITSNFFDTSSSWIDEMGMIVYASISGYVVNAAAVSAIKTSLKNGIENNVVGNYTGNADPYRSYMWDGHYCWGSNQIKAQWASLPIYGIYLNVNPANNALYKECAEEYLHYFHGRNPLSYIYLSNMGTKGANLTSGKSCMQLYHGWFYAGSPLYDGASSTYGQAPGMLAGGANQFYDVPAVIPPASQPPQKSFKDWNTGWNGTLDEHSWEVTEPGIYYQAKYDLVLAYFAGPAGTPTFTPTNTPYAGTPTFTCTITPTVTVTPTNTQISVTILNTCDSLVYNGTWTGANAARSINANAAYITQGTGSLAINITTTASWNDGIASCNGFVPANWAPYSTLTMDVYIDPADAPWNTGSAYHQLALYVNSAAAPGGAKYYRQITSNHDLSTGWNHLAFTIDCSLDIAAHATDPDPAPILATDPVTDYIFIFNSDAAALKPGSLYFDNLVLNAKPPTLTPTWTTAAGTPTFTPTVPYTATYTYTSTATNTGTFTRTGTSTHTRTTTPTYTENGTDTVSPTDMPYIGSPTDTPTVTTTPTLVPCICPSYFGRDAITPYGSYDEVGFLDSNKFVLVEDANVRSLSINIVSSAGGNISMAIYSDAAGAPANLIVQSNVQAGATGWNTLAIPETLLTAGTYWISWQVDPGTVMAYAAGATGDELYLPSLFGAFPGVFPAGNADIVDFMVKADYCPVICGTPTYTRTVSPTISPTCTVSITPTYVGICACPNMFGKTYTGASTADVSGFVVVNWYGISEDGNAQSISINVASGSGQARVGLYTNSSGGAPGVPVSLLCESAATAVAPGWNRIDIPQVGLGSGQVYWIAFQVESGVILSYDTGATGDLYYLPQSFGSFPGNMPAASADVLSFDVQVHYCPVACAPTPSETHTISPTSTVAVNTPTFTYTATSTYTSTPTQTNTLTSTVLPDTFTGTPTCTMTQTQQPGATATQTITPISTTTAIEIKDPVPYPNPCNPGSGLTIGYKLTRDASEITFKLYTTSARLIRKHTVSSLTSAGIKAMLISPDVLENLSQGIYFYVLEAKADNSTTVRSKIDKIIILK